MITLKEILMVSNPVERLWATYQDGMLPALESTLADLDMMIPASRPQHKNVLSHSFRVLENAIAREENGPDLILRTAALFHDIGKPATRRFEDNKVTFDGHEVVGAKMMPAILRRHGYVKSEIRQIQKLVLLHMRSHGFDSGHWTDSAVRRLLTDAGDQETFDTLVNIFYADCTTHNDRKKRSIHRSVDNLVEKAEKVRASDARNAMRPALNGQEVMELTGISPGRELGRIMKSLNADENIHLTRPEAIMLVHFLSQNPL